MKGTTTAGLWVLGIGFYFLMAGLMYYHLIPSDVLQKNEEGRAVTAFVWPVSLPFVAGLYHTWSFALVSAVAGLGLVSIAPAKRAVMSLREWIAAGNPEPMPPDYRDRLMEEEAKQEVEKLIS
jgi:hypothetical protein